MPESKTRSILIVALLSIVALPVIGQDSKAEKIARARSAAPEAISNGATIIDIDGTVLHEGTNGWTCFPRMMEGDDHPMCNDPVWMKFLQAFQNREEFQTDRVGISYMLKGDMNVNNADPFDTTQDEGETWVQEGPHLMVIVPDPTMLEGVSDDPASGGPYVMWGGTSYAHIMVPVAAASPETGGHGMPMHKNTTSKD